MECGPYRGLPPACLHCERVDLALSRKGLAVSTESTEQMQSEDGTEDRAQPRTYVVDGIRYDLEPTNTGRTTTSYAVSCDGRVISARELVVVQHHGASAASRWVILTASKRLERDTVREMAEAVAREIHG